MVSTDDGVPASSDAAAFVDRTLRGEGSRWGDWEDPETGLTHCGASIGAVRGTVRDLHNRHRDLTHDDVTALAGELWSVPLFERRQAVAVLLQRHVPSLRGSDLTRIEGFLRDARVPELVDPLANDVVRPLLDRLDGVERDRADRIVERWAGEDDDGLRRAAALLATDGQPGATHDAV
jgi:hypothetical protein